MTIEYIFREGKPGTKKLILDKKPDDLVDLFQLAKAFSQQSTTFKEFKIAELENETDQEKIRFENTKLALALFQEVRNFDKKYDDAEMKKQVEILKQRAERIQDSLRPQLASMIRIRIEKELHPDFQKLPMNSQINDILNNLAERIQQVDELNLKEKNPEVKSAIEKNESEIESLLSALKNWINSITKNILQKPELKININATQDPVSPPVSLSPSSPGPTLFGETRPTKTSNWKEFVCVLPEDKNFKQETLTVKIEKIPEIPEDFLNLAIAIFENNTKIYNFFGEFSEISKYRLVQVLCTNAIEKAGLYGEQSYNTSPETPNNQVDNADMAAHTALDTADQDYPEHIKKLMHSTAKEKRIKEGMIKHEMDRLGKNYLSPDDESKLDWQNTLKMAEEIVYQAEKYFNLAKAKLESLVKTNQIDKTEPKSPKL